MFRRKDRELLQTLKTKVDKLNQLINIEDSKARLEKEIKSLEDRINELKLIKKSYRPVEDLVNRRVIIMRTPFSKNLPMMYLRDYNSGNYGGYRWTYDKLEAMSMTFEEAYRVKSDFCAGNDCKENLLIVCVDAIVDDSSFAEYKSYLLGNLIKCEENK